MKILSTCLLGLVVLLAPSIACASIVNFTTLDANGTQPNSSVGAFTVTTSTSGTSTIYSFTQTGNLDGVGTANDTLSFDLIYDVYTGSTFDGTNVTLGTPTAYNTGGNIHFMNDYIADPDTNAVEAGNSCSASISNIMYTSGEGFNAPGVSRFVRSINR